MTTEMTGQHIDLVGAFNFHVEQVRGLLDERKALHCKIESLTQKNAELARQLKAWQESYIAQSKA